MISTRSKKETARETFASSRLIDFPDEKNRIKRWMINGRGKGSVNKRTMRTGNRKGRIENGKKKGQDKAKGIRIGRELQVRRENRAHCAVPRRCERWGFDNRTVNRIN